MIGIPLTCGFISKYNISNACIEKNTLLSIIGLIAIIVSSILTAIYTFSVIITAYFQKSEIALDKNKIKYIVIFSFIFNVIKFYLIFYWQKK